MSEKFSSMTINPIQTNKKKQKFHGILIISKVFDIHLNLLQIWLCLHVNCHLNAVLVYFALAWFKGFQYTQVAFHEHIELYFVF